MYSVFAEKELTVHRVTKWAESSFILPPLRSGPTALYRTEFTRYSCSVGYFFGIVKLISVRFGSVYTEPKSLGITNYSVQYGYTKPIYNTNIEILN